MYFSRDWIDKQNRDVSVPYNHYSAKYFYNFTQDLRQIKIITKKTVT